MGTAPQETPPADDENPSDRDEAAPGSEGSGPPKEPAISASEASLLRGATIAKHVALALAICASAALVIDYKNAGDPAFCGVQSGCFAVRASAYSHVYGVPLPNLALPAFAILLGLSIYATSVQSHRLVAGAAGLGALFAIAFIALQAFFVGAFCPWCVAVDSSAIIAGVASILIWFWIGNSERRAAAASVQGTSAGAWAVTGALAIGLPFVWASYPAIPAAPPEILAQQQPGKVTIISFTDFECPFCRKLHPVLDDLRAKHGDKIAFIRKMKPLSGHPGAMPAARAWVCAPLDKRDAVATALYETEPEHLKTSDLVGLATKLGLGDPDAYAACMKAKSTEDAIDRDSQEFSQIKGRGLPFTYVNSRQIIGFNPDKLTSSVEREIGGPSPALPVWAMFVALGLAATVASGLSLRSSKPEG